MVFEHFLSRLGIDEGTALIVRQSEARVVGKGRVFFYDREADPEGLLKPVARVPAVGTISLDPCFVDS